MPFDAYQIFASAEENDIVLKNPAVHAKAVRDPSVKGSGRNAKDAFTEEEIKLMMEYLARDRMGNSIRVLLISGMRVQELLALTQEDIAPDGSTISITKAVKMIDGVPALGSPKSERSIRTIPIPTCYRVYVKELRQMGNGAFLWTSPRSESLLYCVGSFRKQYYKVLASIPGVRKLPPHCCRHTYITQLQASGVPMEMIVRLVGHSDIVTTDGYTHTSLETLSRMVDRIRPNGSKTDGGVA